MAHLTPPQDTAHASWLRHWPPGLPADLHVPETTVHYNLEVSAKRYPDLDCLIFCGVHLTYGDVQRKVESLAGFLQSEFHLARGERVLLCLQNSPQFVIGYYGILRADAVVVPVNPMSKAFEIEHLVGDTGARIAVVARDLVPVIRPLVEAGLIDHVVVADYADYVAPGFDLPLPFAAAPDPAPLPERMTAWRDALSAGHFAAPSLAGPDDLALLPYTSGTTGNPKGCMHTHRTVMVTLVGGVRWMPASVGAVNLATLPHFHVTGMQNSMNIPIYAAGTLVIMPRWDRKVAAELVRRHRVERWRLISTMAIDLVNDPDFDGYDLSSLRYIGGGGAPMPETVATKLREKTGLAYIEGYGLSEAMAATHINPTQRPKPRCLGIPVWGVDCRILDVDSSAFLPDGEVGEIVMDAPQLFKGYWQNPQATQAAFIEAGGKRFFRTGDIGYRDEDGYFFIVDRSKRMINASGFKVWPSEVETLMLRHPAIAEACIISMPDERRGESVKALVVLRRDHHGKTSAQEISDWCRQNMASYKCPRHIEFLDALPRSSTGKILWRELQAREWEGH
ncbi:long-chain-fatty-acid--CoA ligase [Aquamicrobium lusatiense]|uniref:long-chain-fatty-acid--CoA ligase n=1 Tax=Aquamicrobium lusatiense TaxID=89772 RepID=UPI002456F904|nr:long-chain-fatty-acid--CoA ligase [Aquamicrobium lusatiense]MDH4991805.1 long-chain-fatty-acid--CoA ligase [Aquamicrobium lusatiense]